MAGYNPSRFEQELLAAHEQSPSSFTVKLYPEHWHINSGSKCLYNSPIASLLDDIRDHRIPVDFMDLFEAAKAPFYDGCMIVELQDYRSAKNRREVLTTPETTRVVLRPNAETLWADIRLLNQKAGNTWSDHDALEIEARLLLTTSSPLCLEPDVHLTRVANHILRDASPQAPLPLKRKVSVMNEEDEESERARRLKIIQFMNPRYTKPVVPKYSHSPTFYVTVLIA
ncbi:hypothetical protein OBBRIDRAFT_718879 [Obba rivulosa]|uniref:Spt20-like SEP domain-containing protein n=1 Tax=Obba rivulosa TaxID=1052685 RepID=A0A8E2DUZ9_9APHY|nr:hypothetical protein OBBRIDRAFT_718879 [Obba rivulosa]